MNYIGMSAVNLIVYTTIPFYIARSGATLLNLSDTTTIIWSMLFDILLYESEFYPLALVAFIIELSGIVIFSVNKPILAPLKDIALKEMNEE